MRFFAVIFFALLVCLPAQTQVGVSRSGIVISDGNTTSTPLAPSASFTGTCEDVRKYSEITVNLFGAPTVAAGQLFFEFGPSCANLDVSVPYTLTGPTAFVPLPLRVVLPFFRVRYINGGTNLTTLRLTTSYHWQTSKHITRVINQSIDENEPVEMVRSIQGGKSPDGPYTNLPATGVVASQSTNALLGIGGVFNASGTIVSTLGYLAASVSVKSNFNSAAQGLEFQWFADLAGARSLGMTSFTYGSAPNLTSVQVPIKGPYYRVKYTNGASAQTTFELVSSLLVTAPPADVLPISSTITGNNAASIVKAHVTGLTESGAYSDVALSNSSSLKVAIADRPSEVRSRTRVIIPVNRTVVPAGATTLYTVTGGKTLYISAFAFSMTNNNNAAFGEWRLRDSTTVRAGYLMPPRTGGTPASSASTSPTLPEPMPFSTNVNVILITGTVEIAGFLIGYEE